MPRAKNASYDASRPTAAAYGVLQAAYDFFNAELFNGELPPCLITFQRHRGAYGYYSPHRFSLVGEDGVTTDEIALNPAHFAERPTVDTLSTLVHEMVHLWQQHFGKPPRRCYHDRQWAEKMKLIGLHPTSTGLPGGRETGPSMTHYIVAGGPYEAAFIKWAAVVDTPLFQDNAFRLAAGGSGSGTAGTGTSGKGSDVEKKRASKTKFTCPNCETNAWGKPGLFIICGECSVRMNPPVGEDHEEVRTSNDENTRSAGTRTGAAAV